MARESPEHATQSSEPFMYSTFDVVPIDMAVCPSSPPRSSLSSWTMFLLRHATGSATSSSWSFSRSCGSCVMQNSDAFSPFEPCPSKTHSSASLSDPWNGQQTTPRSWLILAFAMPRGPGITPCRVLVPMCALSNGALERRLFALPRSTSFAW